MINHEISIIAYKKYRKYAKKIKNGAKIYQDICPRTLRSVPRSEQFSESAGLPKNRLSNCSACAQGGGYLTKFCTGRLRPEVQPLTLSYIISAEKVPLLYTFY